MFFNRRKNEFEYGLDNGQADEMLQRVFKSVGKQPNTIPFDKLILRKQIRLGSLYYARAIAIAMLIFVLLVPFLLRYEYSKQNTPIIERHHVENGLLWIDISDESVGVNYMECYAKSEDGSIIKPLRIDRKVGRMAFDATCSPLNIYIMNYAGDVTHAVYTAN